MDVKLFDELPLDSDLKEKVKEAWEKSLAEAVAVREAELAKEYQKKYERTRARLGTVMEKYAADKLDSHIEKLVEARKAYENATSSIEADLAKLKRDNTRIVKEHLMALDKKTDMVLESKLKGIVGRYTKFKKSVNAALNESRNRYSENLAAHKEDVSKKAAMIITKLVENRVDRELAELKEDIEKAAKNEFGMKLFEAFEQTFVNVHSAAAPTLKSAIRKKEEAERKLQLVEAKAKKAIMESRKKIEAEREKAKRLVESARREAKIAELVSDLSGDTKDHMKRVLKEQKGSIDLLESVYKREMKRLNRQKMSENHGSEASQIITEGKLMQDTEDNVLHKLRLLSGIRN